MGPLNDKGKISIKDPEVKHFAYLSLYPVKPDAQGCQGQATQPEAVHNKLAKFISMPSLVCTECLQSQEVAALEGGPCDTVTWQTHQVPVS